MVQNLLSLFSVRSEQDSILGAGWYPAANAIVHEWARTYHRNFVTVACVIAAISPQCEWERNLIIADDVLAERAISIGGALHENIRKARAILADNATTTTKYFKSGPKVFAFACNLAGAYDYPTIDTHASQAAMGDVRFTVGLKLNHYEAFSRAYIAAASRVDVKPAFFQSIIWHTWKRLHPRVAKIRARTQWIAIETE
jgi:hypothetical protein